MNNIKGQGQRLIPEYLLKYLQNQKDNGMNIAQLVDSKGNPRFIEGEGAPASVTGLTAEYCKWSLSGTHLMLVLAGTLANNMSTGQIFARFYLPKWILDKIVPIFANRVEGKTINCYDTSYGSQQLAVFLNKADTSLNLGSATITLTADRNFRVQFDLLIDSE